MDNKHLRNSSRELKWQKLHVLQISTETISSIMQVGMGEYSCDM